MENLSATKNKKKKRKDKSESDTFWGKTLPLLESSKYNKKVE
jgi:hypothetical protein